MSDVSRDGSRVVITGLGVVTALGSEINSFWQSLLDGKSGIRRVSRFDVSELPCQIGGEIDDFDPSDYMPKKHARRMSRASQLALAAAQNALRDGQLPNPYPDPERFGVYFGTAIGGLDWGVESVDVFRTKGYERVSPFSIPATLPNMPAFHITHHVGALGINCTFATACATGTQTIGEAAHAIRHGKADVMLAGGSDGTVLDYVLAGFSRMRAIPSSFNDDPQRASRPFDALREGFVLSEGAACVVLESLENARSRGANIYAEIAGYSSSSDAFNIAAPDPTAAGAIRTMAGALKDANLSTEQVSYINAHGTSTPSNDAVETQAIKNLFGEKAYAIPISSTKSMLGHSMGASGAIEAVVCALTIDRGVIHPTTNYEVPDPELDLDYVPNKARNSMVDVILSNSFGLGGQNACLVFKRMEA